MEFNDGLLTLCALENQASPGDMPREKLKKKSVHFYAERTAGFARQYAAKGANEQIDMMARIWKEPAARIGMYVILEDGRQYRIDNVQQARGEDGLAVTDLTLRALEEFYDVER